MNKVNINNVTPIRDEFDLNGSIKAHFSLIKTHPSGRRAYLRTEKSSNITSIEICANTYVYERNNKDICSAK